MAKIIWNKSASEKLEAHLDYALAEFGQKCVTHWYHDILRIEARLSLHPLSYGKILELADRDKDYRGAIIMKNFQLVHFYDADNDTVYIDAIWDLRMNPQALIQSLK